MKKCGKCQTKKPLKDFYKNRSKTDGLTTECKDCCKINVQKHQMENKQALLDRCKKYHESEGYGVYEAIFPSGKYIGSGQLKTRRKGHLAGHTRIARSLGESAMEVRTLIICSKEMCEFYEMRLIESIGLDDLVNRRVKT